AGGGRGAGGGGTDPNAGMYIINVESGQLTRVPPAAPQNADGGGGRGRGGAAGAGGGGANMVFARDGRTLYFRSGSGLYAAPIQEQAGGGNGSGRHTGGGGSRRGH